MPKWRNGRQVAYHGTDSAALGAVPPPRGNAVPFLVNLALCKPFTDFGQGFYTTTRLHQAKQWANLRVLRQPPVVPRLFAVVLRFDLDRDWLAALDVLAFVRPIQDFYDLVDDCRSGFAPHQRVAPHPAPYDVVYGPVSLWPQKLVIGDCDQLSFHTRRAVSGLPQPTLHAVSNHRNASRIVF